MYLYLCNINRDRFLESRDWPPFVLSSFSAIVRSMHLRTRRCRRTHSAQARSGDPVALPPRRVACPPARSRRFLARAMIRFAAYVVAAAVAAGAQALQISDDRGVAISLARPTQRIVSLAPHLAEIAFAAGAGAKLVGVSSFSRHPSEAQRLPVVASHGRVDFERLITMRPDLVLAWRSGNSPLQIARLERLGFRVFVTEVRLSAAQMSPRGERGNSKMRSRTCAGAMPRSAAWRRSSRSGTGRCSR